MLLLQLAACGYPTYYPNTSALTDRTDTGDPPVTAPPCGESWASDPVELRAVSYAPVPLTLYAVASDCTEASLGPVTRSEVRSVATYPGAVFAAREDDGAFYAYARIPYGNASYIWEIW